MTDYTAHYEAVRLRLSDFVRGLPASDAETPVPACPGWTVRGVLSHVVGIPADVRRGSLPGPDDGPRWTAAQVEARQLANAGRNSAVVRLMATHPDEERRARVAQGEEYERVNDSLFLHPFLKSYFAVHQAGACVFGVENHPDREGAAAAVARLRAALEEGR